MEDEPSASGSVRKTRPSRKTATKTPKATQTTHGELIVAPALEQVDRPAATAVTSGKKEAAAFDKGRLEYELHAGNQRLGVLGRFFGAGWTPAHYISAFVAVGAFIVIVATFFCAQPGMQEARQYFASLLSGVLGYLFGARVSVPRHERD